MTNTIKISKLFTPDLWLGTEVSIPEDSNEEQKIEAFIKEYSTLVKTAQRLSPGINFQPASTWAGTLSEASLSPYNQPPPVIQVEKIDDIKTLDEQIRSCTELNVLHSYKFIVKGKPEEKTYLIMLEQLSKK